MNSNLTLTGSKTFRSNSAEYGGGVGALKSTVTFIGKSTFEKNLAVKCGGGVTAHFSTLRFTGSTNFTDNSVYGEDNTAKFGGGITARNNLLSLTGNIFKKQFRQQIWWKNLY